MFSFIKKLGIVVIMLSIMPGCFGNKNKSSEDGLGGADQELVRAIQESGDRVFFDLDSSELSIESKNTLDKQAAIMLQYPKVGFEIEGHADEQGTKDYNFALGERRAIKVKEYLTSQGVKSANLSIISYGKEMPFVEGRTQEAYSQNRRAVTVPKF